MARYALVIGIAKYDNFTNLPKAVNDAENIAQLLRQHGRFDVQPLPGKLIESENRWQVTAEKKLLGKELGQVLRLFLLEKAKGSEALIYFAGHGFEAPSLTGEPKGYLATSDCNKDGQNAIAFDDFNTLIAKSQLSSLVVLLDCCYAGSLLERSFIRSSFPVFNSKQDYCLITASRAFERAREDAEGGIFTKAAIKGLSQDKADVTTGEVNVNDLMSFVSRELKGSGQEAIYMGGGRSISLVFYPGKNQVAIGVVSEECPYRGLQAFDKEHAKFFFGQQKVVNLIQQKLTQANFIPIIGPSGSGKSSVVLAGLIPQLNDSEWQILDPIKPGFEPLIKLRGAFQQFFPGAKKEKLLKDLIENETNSLAAILKNLPGSAKFLLIIDQFEEVFTGGASRQEKQRFIELLTQVVDITDSRLAVVITMRADFLEPCLHYSSVHHLIQTQAVYIPPLTGLNLKDTITEPAKLQGHSLEEALLLKIFQDVRQEPGFLPLLEFALTKLWDKRDQEKHQLTLEQYEKLGELTGALNLHAKKVYEYQDFEEESPTQERTQQEKEWIRLIFLRLVRTGEGEKDTRQRQPKATLLNIAGDDANQQQELSELLDGEAGLVKGRLLVTGKDEQGEAWIDLAHEALIEGWQQFAWWRQQDRDLRRLSDRLADSRREWCNKGKSEQYFIQGGLLAEVRDSWQQLQLYLQSPQEDEDFYQRSDNHEKGWMAELEMALTESRLREKAARVENLLSVQPLDSLVLAIQAMGENQDKLPQQILAPVQNSLNRVMNKVRVSIPFRGHEDWVNSVAINSDGQMIVSGGRDGTVRLWNLQGQSLAEPFRGHEDWVNSVAISSDGQTIVSGGRDGTVRLWNLQGQSLAEPFRGHENAVNSVAFALQGDANSSDEQMIVSGGADGTVRLWNLQGQPLAEPFCGHKNAVNSVAFALQGDANSSDGQMIVSGGGDSTVRLWNLQGQPLAEPFRGHEHGVNSVAFALQGDANSSDGQMIVSGGGDRTVRLWNLQGQPLAEPFRGHKNPVISVAISSDGQTIVSGDADGTVRLWNLQGQPLAEPFRGHEDEVNSVAISTDGQTIVSGGDDGTVRLWNLQGQPLAEPFRGHEREVNSVAISSDGQTIVSGGVDGTVRLWNLQGQPLAEPFRGHEHEVISVAISSDGQTIVSGGVDGTVRLWNLQGQPLAKPFRGHKNAVISVAISSDGQTIVSGGGDDTVRLWNLQGQSLAKPFRGHEREVNSVAISSDGQTIASGGGDGTVRLWNLQGQPLAEPFRGHEREVISVAISSDGQMIVSGGGDDTVRLWNLQGQPLAEPFRGHEDWVISVAISSDGQTIVSGGDDGTVRLWNLQGQPLAEPFRGHEREVNSVAISSDGQTIVSGGKDGTVRLWRGGWRAWLQVCCDRLRYHPIFTNPQTEEAKAACETCQKYVWSKVSG
ncbi:MAG: caspase family protein [Nostoc sp.]|uniref:nSTAND1 domain-containing NTPase n=1 Tax=Nostoc sp. TaxID=1180 RepID=UPI002FF097D4